MKKATIIVLLEPNEVMGKLKRQYVIQHQMCSVFKTTG